MCRLPAGCGKRLYEAREPICLEWERLELERISVGMIEVGFSIAPIFSEQVVGQFDMEATAAILPSGSRFRPSRFEGHYSFPSFASFAALHY